jgi:predicted CopG family antitoxin
MPLTEVIRFVATEQDKALLDLISKQDGNSSMSAMIRRLIRDEAKRRGVEVVSQNEPTIEAAS